MKFLSRILMVVFLLFSARLAHADHHLVFVHSVVKLSSFSCAVELEISANAQDGFEGVDRIEVDGVALSLLGDSVADAINTGGHVDTGDKILFASDSFIADTGISADQSFSDNFCGTFQPNSVFDFVIDDPLFGGPNTIIDSLVAGGFFGMNNTAVTKSSAGSSSQFVDLSASTLEVTNNDGVSVTVGTSGGGNPAGGNNSGGGCGLTSVALTSQGAGFFIGMGALLLFGAGIIMSRGR